MRIIGKKRVDLDMSLFEVMSQVLAYHSPRDILVAMIKIIEDGGQVKYSAWCTTVVPKLKETATHFGWNGKV